MPRSATSSTSTPRPIGNTAPRCATNSCRSSRLQAPVRVVLRRIFEASRDLYLFGPDGPRGCLTVITAASEAIADPEIRGLAIQAIAALDQTFAALFSKAIARGELPASSDADALAKIATATLHNLAIRARVGAPGSELQALIDAAVAAICGAADRR